MFGLPMFSLIALGVAALIVFFLLMSVIAEVSRPFLPFMSPDSFMREMARQARVQQAQITWGMIAMGFCLLAVILAF